MSNAVQVKFYDPTSETSRSLLLDSSISSKELVEILKASFSLRSSIVGFRDDQGVIYPISIVPRSLGQLTRKKLSIIEESSGDLSSNIGIDYEDSEATLYTDTMAEKAFNVIDTDGDGIVTAEDLEKFVEYGAPYVSSYLDGITVGRVFSQTFFEETGLSTGENANLNDFCAWYLSTRNVKLRSLIVDIINAEESLEKRENKVLQRVKSQSSLITSPTMSEQNSSDWSKEVSVEDTIVEIQNISGLSHVSLKGLMNAFISMHGNALKKSDIKVTRDDFHHRLRSLVDVTHGSNRHENTSDLVVVYRILDSFYNAFLDSKDISTASLTSILCGMTLFCGGDLQENLMSIYEWFSIVELENNNSRDVSDSSLREYFFHVSNMLFMLSSQMERQTQSDPRHFGLNLATKIIKKNKSFTPGIWRSPEFVQSCMIGLKYIFALLRGESVEDLGEQAVESTFFSPLSKQESASSVSREEVPALLSEYEGGTINISDARKVLGLSRQSPDDIIHLLQVHFEDDYYLTHASYQQVMMRLLAKHYAHLPVSDRSIADFLIDRLYFVSVDTIGAGSDERDLCDAFELSMSLMLFSNGSPAKKADLVIQLLQATEDINIDISDIHATVDANYMELCLTPILKTVAALDPQFSDISIIDELSADVAYYFLKKFSNNVDVILLSTLSKWIATLYKLFEGINGQILIRQALLDVEIDSSTGTDKLIAGINGIFGDDHDCGELIIETSSPEEDGVDVMPSSAVLLELQAVKKLFGYDGFRADDIMEILAENSPRGVLTFSGWTRATRDIMTISNVPSEKQGLGLQLASRVFESFATNVVELPNGKMEPSCSFVEMAAGMVLLSDSPMEDKVMVSFTLLDSNRDSKITHSEFQTLVLAYIRVVCALSQIAEAKVSAVGTSMEELAAAVTQECFGALGMDENSLLSIENVSEVANDCVVLAESVEA